MKQIDHAGENPPPLNIPSLRLVKEAIEMLYDYIGGLHSPQCYTIYRAYIPYNVIRYIGLHSLKCYTIYRAYIPYNVIRYIGPTFPTMLCDI